MKRFVRKIIIHLIVQSFLRSNKKGKKAIIKTAIKLALRNFK